MAARDPPWANLGWGPEARLGLWYWADGRPGPSPDPEVDPPRLPLSQERKGNSWIPSDQISQNQLLLQHVLTATGTNIYFTRKKDFFLNRVNRKTFIRFIT